MMTVFYIFFLIVYGINVLLLFYFAFHTYLMVYWCSKYKSKTEMPQQGLTDYPLVTIQLPIFNEQYVAERVIRKTMEMDYPKEKMEIQILDDSTDETLVITRNLAKYYYDQDYNVVHMHREKRTGHKGGALREGLEIASGEYVAIFDADFIPNREFLKKTLPVFEEDEKIGMVQTRWGHLNSDYSFLTRAQAIGIDGHFSIDQIARGGYDKLFMNFNGTAGVWKKDCIYDAGNWQDDTLTEDFDLSYRAMLKGWKFRYVKDIVNLQELPVQVSGFKSQQFRWAKGSIQTAIKLTRTILKAKLPFIVKLEAVTHLTYYSVHPLMVINIICTIPMLLIHPKIHQYYLPFYMGGPFFILATLGPLFFYSYSQIFLYKDWLRKLKWVPFLTIVGTGIAVNNTRAFIEAIMGKRTEFIRTPKFGILKNTDKWQNKKYKSPISFVSVIELFLGFLAITGIYISVATDNFFAIPFLAIYSSAFLYIFSLEMYQTLALNREIMKKRMQARRISP